VNCIRLVRMAAYWTGVAPMVAGASRCAPSSGLGRPGDTYAVVAWVFRDPARERDTVMSTRLLAAPRGLIVPMKTNHRRGRLTGMTDHASGLTLSIQSRLCMTLCINRTDDRKAFRRSIYWTATAGNLCLSGFKAGTVENSGTEFIGRF